MANKTYATEWLEKAYHDLDSAMILFNAGHYTDTIGYILHQSIEKIFKSLLAYENKPILKTHNLVELHELLTEHMELPEDEIILLGIATTYNTQQRYPTPHKRLPPREEIARILALSQKLLDRVCRLLDIDQNVFLRHLPL